MTTRLKIGPNDHGMPITDEELGGAEADEGYHYELIEGKLYVSPSPHAPEGAVERWLRRKLEEYADSYPETINYVHEKARVFVPDQSEVTVPEPDVAAYQDFPLTLPLRQLRWQDLSPLLVVEVLAGDDPKKDLVRNVDLYAKVPSIQEYWIFDIREEPDNPTLLVYRRRDRRRWRKRIVLEAGSTYTTDLLPGFSLKIDPHT